MASNYEAYTKRYPDLLANFKKSWEGKISLTQYGQMHYNAYGKNEGRKMPGGSSKTAAKAAAKPSKFTVDGVAYPIRKTSSFLGSNPNKGYKARASIEGGSTTSQDKLPAGGIGGVNLYMNKRGQRAFVHSDGATYYERELGSGTFTNNTREGGTVNISEWTHRDQPEPKPEPKKSSGTSRGVRYSGPPKYAPVDSGPTSSSLVNTGISNVNTAVAAGTAAVTAAANPDYPGAPSWVKNHADFIKWKKSQSAQSGFISTINTSSTGLTDDEYEEYVKVTALG